MNDADIPRNEPLAARAGLTWKWRREDLAASYPASSWTLKYWFKKTGAAGANFSVVASADGDNFSVTVDAAMTLAYTSGKYAWAAEVSGGASEVYEIDRGTLDVLPRYDQAANLDDRSHARKMLEAIEALLENRASIDQQEYAINGRSLKRMTVKELTDWRDYYLSETAAETMRERARNGQGGNRLVVKL